MCLPCDGEASGSMAAGVSPRTEQDTEGKDTGRLEQAITPRGKQRKDPSARAPSSVPVPVSCALVLPSPVLCFSRVLDSTDAAHPCASPEATRLVAPTPRPLPTRAAPLPPVPCHRHATELRQHNLERFWQILGGGKVLVLLELAQQLLYGPRATDSLSRSACSCSKDIMKFE